MEATTTTLLDRIDEIDDIVRRLREAANALTATPLDDRDPIRERVSDLMIDYLLVNISKERLRELLAEEQERRDTKCAAVMLEILSDYEQRRAEVLGDLGRLRRVLEVREPPLVTEQTNRPSEGG